MCPSFFFLHCCICVLIAAAWFREDQTLALPLLNPSMSSSQGGHENMEFWTQYQYLGTCVHLLQDCHNSWSAFSYHMEMTYKQCFIMLYIQFWVLCLTLWAIVFNWFTWCQFWYFLSVWFSPSHVCLVLFSMVILMSLPVSDGGTCFYLELWPRLHWVCNAGSWRWCEETNNSHKIWSNPNCPKPSF